MNGLDLHKQAEEMREQEKFQEALRLCDEAFIAYSKEGNTAKLAEICASRALTLRHLADSTGDKSFLILAKYSAKAGVKIIENSGSETGITIPLYTLGKVFESLEKFDKAAEKIGEAIEKGSDLPKISIAEMKTRLDAISFRTGEQSALESFNADVQDLENGEFEDDHVKNVWTSGAYMHMAEALISKGEKDEASQLLSKARAIIDSDARLTLRSRQLSKISGNS